MLRAGVERSPQLLDMGALTMPANLAGNPAAPILLAEDGGVYLWLRDLDDQTAGPRACRLPYNKDLHRKVDDTLRKLQAGEWLVGTRLPGGDARRIRIEFEAVKRDTGAHKSSQN